jgi:hypothetical protein
VIRQSESPSFMDYYPRIEGGFLFRYRTIGIWLGGTSVPRSWLHNCFQREVFLFFLCVITMRLMGVH